MTKVKTSPNACINTEEMNGRPATADEIKQIFDNIPRDKPVPVGKIFERVVLEKLDHAKASGIQQKETERLPIAWGRTEPALLAAGPGVEPWWQRSVRKPNKSVQNLASLLFHLGGNKACIPFEEVPLCEAYATLGKLVVPDEVKMKSGEPCRCHQNCLLEWTKSMGKLSMVTGFGLSDDNGMWCAHSWLTNEKGQILETTVPRSMYFGIQLNHADLVKMSTLVVVSQGGWVLAV